MKKFMATFLIVSGLVPSSFLFAQVTHTLPNPATIAQHRVNRLTRLLTLTTTQQQQALTIFTGAASTNATTRASLKTARQSLAAAVLANDNATIQNQSMQIGSLTGTLVQTDALANAAFYQILTAAQQTLYNNLHEGGMGGMRGFGRRGN